MKIKKILVSQPRPASEKSPYFDIAKKYNVEVVFRPFIKVEGLTSREFRHQRINLADFTAIIFTARTAVDHFFRLCEELRVSIPDTMRYFCTSESIALYLQKYIVYRKRKISFGVTGKLNDPQLVAAIVKNKKENFLFPVSDVFKEDVSVLEQNGIKFTKAVMYRTVSNDFTPEEPFDYDMLVFFSPHGIASLQKNFAEFDQKKSEIHIATFGQTTAKAARDAGLEINIEAPSSKYPSMTAAIDAYLAEQPNDEPSKPKKAAAKKSASSKGASKKSETAAKPATKKSTTTKASAKKSDAPSKSAPKKSASAKSGTTVKKTTAKKSTSGKES